MSKNESDGSSSSPENSEPLSITKLKEKLADRSVQESLKGFSKTIQFSFTDLKQDYLFTLNDGKLVSLLKRNMPDANITITVANSLMESLMNKTSDPMSAFMSGKLRIKGPMDDLLRLQKLLS